MMLSTLYACRPSFTRSFSNANIRLVNPALSSRPRFDNGLSTFHAPIRLLSATGNNQNNDEWKVPKNVYVPEDCLDFSFIRSSGAGGQNVNKVNTCVQLKCHVPSLDSWIPTEVRQRLQQQQQSRINKENVLVLQVQEHRTQSANRKTAMDKLRKFILDAWARPKVRKMKKGISQKTKRQRKEFKRKRSIVKEGRRPVKDW